ncbi:MAG TPA: hypothetical protein VGN83_13455 [Falsiroseomonas sp.]|nr:hypothetical protein [Falsiroseomonas sp.]
MDALHQGLCIGAQHGLWRTVVGARLEQILRMLANSQHMLKRRPERGQAAHGKRRFQALHHLAPLLAQRFPGANRPIAIIETAGKQPVAHGRLGFGQQQQQPLGIRRLLVQPDDRRLLLAQRSVTVKSRAGADDGCQEQCTSQQGGLEPVLG